MVRGLVRAGWRVQEEAASPWFPQAASGTAAAMASASALRYPGSRKQGLGASLQLKGVARLSPHWHVGVSLTGSHSPQFEEFSGMLFLRRFFKPRAAVFSSDLFSPGDDGMGD